MRVSENYWQIKEKLDINNNKFDWEDINENTDDEIDNSNDL